METRDWHIPFSATISAAVTGLWACFLHYLAPHYASFLAAVPFAVVLCLWWFNMVGGTVLALGHFPLLVDGEPVVHATDMDGKPVFKKSGLPVYRRCLEDEAPILRRWNSHICRKGIFRFLLLYFVLEATYSLRTWNSAPLHALAVAVEGYLITMEFAKILRNYGQLLGDRGLQDAGSAVQGGAPFTFFRWLRGKSKK